MVNEIIKKSLFKVKKVVIYEKDWQDNILGVEEKVGILIPKYYSISKKFSNDSVQMITLTGEILTLENEDIAIKNTRITDVKLKNALDKVIEWAKNNYKLQKETVVLYEKYMQKEKEINDSKGSELDIFNELKIAQDYLTNNEVIDELNSIATNGQQFESDNDSDTYYRMTIRNDRKMYEGIFVILKHSSIVNIHYFKCIETYDNVCKFVDEPNEYLETNKDFQVFKSKNFRNIDKSKLKSIEGEEQFFKRWGDKGHVDICHRVDLDLNLECNGKNIEEIKNKFKALLEILSC